MESQKGVLACVERLAEDNDKAGLAAAIPNIGAGLAQAIYDSSSIGVDIFLMSCLPKNSPFKTVEEANTKLRNVYEQHLKFCSPVQYSIKDIFKIKNMSFEFVSKSKIITLQREELSKPLKEILEQKAADLEALTPAQLVDFRYKVKIFKATPDQLLQAHLLALPPTPLNSSLDDYLHLFNKRMEPESHLALGRWLAKNFSSSTRHPMYPMQLCKKVAQDLLEYHKSLEPKPKSLKVSPEISTQLLLCFKSFVESFNILLEEYRMVEGMGWMLPLPICIITVVPKFHIGDSQIQNLVAKIDFLLNKIAEPFCYIKNGRIEVASQSEKQTLNYNLLSWLAVVLQEISQRQRMRRNLTGNQQQSLEGYCRRMTEVSLIERLTHGLRNGQLQDRMVMPLLRLSNQICLAKVLFADVIANIRLIELVAQRFKASTFQFDPSVQPQFLQLCQQVYIKEGPARQLLKSRATQFLQLCLNRFGKSNGKVIHYLKFVTVTKCTAKFIQLTEQQIDKALLLQPNIALLLLRCLNEKMDEESNQIADAFIKKPENRARVLQLIEKKLFHAKELNRILKMMQSQGCKQEVTQACTKALNSFFQEAESSLSQSQEQSKVLDNIGKLATQIKAISGYLAVLQAVPDQLLDRLAATIHSISKHKHRLSTDFVFQMMHQTAIRLSGKLLALVDPQSFKEQNSQLLAVIGNLLNQSIYTPSNYRRFLDLVQHRAIILFCSFQKKKVPIQVLELILISSFHFSLRQEEDKSSKECINRLKVDALKNGIRLMLNLFEQQTLSSGAVVLLKSVAGFIREKVISDKNNFPQYHVPAFEGMMNNDEQELGGNFQEQLDFYHQLHRNIGSINYREIPPNFRRERRPGVESLPVEDFKQVACNQLIRLHHAIFEKDVFQLCRNLPFLAQLLVEINIFSGKEKGLSLRSFEQVRDRYFKGQSSKVHKSKDLALLLDLFRPIKSEGVSFNAEFITSLLKLGDDQSFKKQLIQDFLNELTPLINFADARSTQFKEEDIAPLQTVLNPMVAYVLKNEGQPSQGQGGLSLLCKYGMLFPKQALGLAVRLLQSAKQANNSSLFIVKLIDTAFSVTPLGQHQHQFRIKNIMSSHSTKASFPINLFYSANHSTETNFWKAAKELLKFTKQARNKSEVKSLVSEEQLKKVAGSLPWKYQPPAQVKLILTILVESVILSAIRPKGKAFANSMKILTILLEKYSLLVPYLLRLDLTSIYKKVQQKTNLLNYLVETQATTFVDFLMALNAFYPCAVKRLLLLICFKKDISYFKREGANDSGLFRSYVASEVVRRITKILRLAQDCQDSTKLQYYCGQVLLHIELMRLKPVFELSWNLQEQYSAALKPLSDNSRAQTVLSFGLGLILRIKNYETMRRLKFQVKEGSEIQKDLLPMSLLFADLIGRDRLPMRGNQGRPQPPQFIQRQFFQRMLNLNINQGIERLFTGLYRPSPNINNLREEEEPQFQFEMMPQRAANLNHLLRRRQSVIELEEHQDEELDYLARFNDIQRIPNRSQLIPKDKKYQPFVPPVLYEQMALVPIESYQAPPQTDFNCELGIAFDLLSRALQKGQHHYRQSFEVVSVPEGNFCKLINQLCRILTSRAKSEQVADVSPQNQFVLYLGQQQAPVKQQYSRRHGLPMTGLIGASPYMPYMSRNDLRNDLRVDNPLNFNQLAFVELAAKQLQSEEVKPKEKVEVVKQKQPKPRQKFRRMLQELGLPQNFLQTVGIDQYFFDSLSPDLQTQVLLGSIGNEPRERRQQPQLAIPQHQQLDQLHHSIFEQMRFDLNQHPIAPGYGHLIGSPANQSALQPDIQPEQPILEQPALQQVFLEPQIQMPIPAIQPAIQPGVQPLVQPVIQPAVLPVIQPAVQPIIQPAVQPAVQPIFQPAIQPIFPNQPWQRSVQPTEPEVSVPPAVNPIPPQIDLPPGIEMDFLMELPEDIRNEILAQHRAILDPVQPQNDNQAFLQSLEPALREDILVEASPEFLAGLSADLRAEAETIRERRARRAQFRIDQHEQHRANDQSANMRIKVPINSGQYFPEVSAETIEKAFQSLNLKAFYGAILLGALLQNKRVSNTVLDKCLSLLEEDSNSSLSEKTIGALQSWVKDSLCQDFAAWANSSQKGIFYERLLCLLALDLNPTVARSVIRIMLALPARKMKPSCLPGLMKEVKQRNIKILSKLEQMIELNPELLPELETELGKALKKGTMQERAQVASYFLRLGTNVRCPQLFEVHKWAVDNNYEDHVFNTRIWSIYCSNETKNEKPQRKMTVEEEEEDPHQDQFKYVVSRGSKILNATIQRLIIQQRRIMNKPIGRAVRSFPENFSFQTKMKVFRHELQLMRQSSIHPRVHVIINRSNLFAESYNQIMARSAQQMRGGLNVKFNDEEGYDAGGIAREWFTLLSRQIFNPNYCLFQQSQTGNTYQPCPYSNVNLEHFQYFKFVGRIVGKALYEGCYVDAFFSSSFYKHILGKGLNLQDMEQQDYQLFKSLKWILDNPLEPGLFYFTYDTQALGKRVCKELVPGGSTVEVTDQNKVKFVEKVCEAKMLLDIEKQLDAFMVGFNEIIPTALVRIFNPKELELMISGLPEVDLQDLRVNTQYEGYSRDSEIILWFWEIMETFDQRTRALFIQFVTGTSRVPPEGFAGLKGINGPSKFTINRDFNQTHLPKAHTCFNQLDLPQYPTKEMLMERLVVALTWGNQGFGFI